MDVTQFDEESINHIKNNFEKYHQRCDTVKEMIFLTLVKDGFFEKSIKLNENTSLDVVSLDTYPSDFINIFERNALTRSVLAINNIIDLILKTTNKFNNEAEKIKEKMKEMNVEEASKEYLAFLKKYFSSTSKNVLEKNKFKMHIYGIEYDVDARKIKIKSNNKSINLFSALGKFFNIDPETGRLTTDTLLFYEKKIDQEVFLKRWKEKYQLFEKWIIENCSDEKEIGKGKFEYPTYLMLHISFEYSDILKNFTNPDGGKNDIFLEDGNLFYFIGIDSGYIRTQQKLKKCFSVYVR